MPELLCARAAVDTEEERQIRKLAASRHAPGDWIRRARMVVRSWDGLRTTAIAAELGCHPQTVRERLARFNAEGLAGLGDRPGAGRKRRLTEAERGLVLAFARRTPPGRLMPQREGLPVAEDEAGEAHWTLDTLVDAAAARHDDRAQPGPPGLPRGGQALATDPQLGGEQGSRFRPKRARIVALYTAPPGGVTVVCADELGPVIPRTFPPPPGWSDDGHRIKVPLEYGRGPEKVWVYGALRVGDGQAVTLTARSRNTAGYRQLLEAVAAANPDGEVRVITDNLASHKRPPILTWLAEHTRIQQVFIPVAACWLNLQAAWWRLFRRAALAGQSFADDHEIDQATTVATAQLNRRAKAWIWGRPPKPQRHLRRLLVYRI